MRRFGIAGLSEDPTRSRDRPISLGLVFQTRDSDVKQHIDDALVSGRVGHTLTVDGRTFLAKVQSSRSEVGANERECSMQFDGKIPVPHVAVQTSSCGCRGGVYTSHRVAEALISAAIFGRDMEILQAVHISPLNLDPRSLLTLDVEQTRKARVLERLIAEAMWSAGILGGGTARAGLCRTGIQILLGGTLRKGAVLSGVIPLRGGLT